MRVFAAVLTGTLLGLMATACATSNSNAGGANAGAGDGAKSDRADPSQTKQEEVKVGAERKPTETVNAAPPTGGMGPLPVEGKALVGAWRGKDSRDIIGTLNFCEDGRVKAVINGERLGGRGGSLLTWTATKIGAGEAKIEMVASANEMFSPFLMVAKRTSEAEMVVAAVTGSVTSVDSAPAEDRVNLERVSTSPTCD